jgi:hypothetical protein
MENKAETIRQLTEKWLETGDDSILDEMKYVIHHGLSINPFNRRILERYLESTPELHVHFIKIGFGLESKSEHQCAVAKSLVSPLSCTVNTASNIAGGETWIDEFDRGQSKRPVLIDVHQLVQSPEGMVEPILIPSAVRLQSLDDCLGLNGHTAESISSKLSIKPVHTLANRELVVSGRSPVVTENQLIDDMVKRRPDIMQAVTNDTAKTQIGVGERCDEGIERIFIGVFLDNNGAVILMPSDLGTYRCEMHFCPDDFFTDSIEGMIHDKERNSKDPQGSRDTDSETWRRFQSVQERRQA